MKLFKNLKLRLLVTLFITLFALFYGFGYMVIYTLKSSYKQSVMSTLTTLSKEIKHDLMEYPNKLPSLDEIQEEFDIPQLFAQIISYDPQTNSQTVLQYSEDLKENRLSLSPSITMQVKNNMNKTFLYTEYHPNISQKKLYFGATLLKIEEEKEIYAIFAIPYDRHTPQVQKMTMVLWIGLLAVLAAILAMAYMLISQSFSSVKKVTNTVKSIRIEEQNPHIPKANIAHEIDDLIDTFNSLLNELHNAYMQVKQFGQNASHELKTPLTIIQGEIEVGLRKDRSNEEYRVILNKIAKEADALNSIIEKILFLSSSTKKELISHFEEVYIDEILLEAIEEKRLLANKKEIHLNIKKIDATTALGVPALLKIAISNLLDNAIKYSLEKSTIDIFLDERVLGIYDSGIGIKEEDMEHIFKQFFRSNEAKKDNGGSGLGLAIVKNILDLHSFYIKVTSEKAQGTKVTITF